MSKQQAVSFLSNKTKGAANRLFWREISTNYQSLSVNRKLHPYILRNLSVLSSLHNAGVVMFPFEVVYIKYTWLDVKMLGDFCIFYQPKGTDALKILCRGNNNLTHVLDNFFK